MTPTGLPDYERVLFFCEHVINGFTQLPSHRHSGDLRPSSEFHPLIESIKGRLFVNMLSCLYQCPPQPFGTLLSDGACIVGLPRAVDRRNNARISAQALCPWEPGDIINFSHDQQGQIVTNPIQCRLSSKIDPCFSLNFDPPCDLSIVLKCPFFHVPKIA
jgi:hypothetical protein